METILDIKNLSKTFVKESVLQNVNFTLNRGKITSLLGSSGSGKSTLLRIIAGLDTADSGEIYLEENEISKLQPQDRNIVYLYQEALLFPHLNVFENIAFGLKLRKISDEIIKTKVDNMLEMLGMSEHSKKMSHQLSGGQRQRISFGRAMVIEPKLLLLDEPFGALDGETRQSMQMLFKDLSEKMNLSALFVTHDIKEAITMGDNIAKIVGGNLHQFQSVSEFVNNTESGAQSEIDFWKQFH